MPTHLPQNQFITNSTAIQPPAVEQPATASLTLPASGAVAEPFAAQLGATAAETAATDPGRAVAATLSHNKITQAVEIQSSCGGTGVQPFVHAEAAWEVPAPRNISGKQEGRTGIEVGTSQTPGSPMLSARTLPIPSGQAPGPHEANNDLERLIGVAGKRRRRPLALPPFAPDFPELWKAMHDKSAPRTVLDPLWADASPLFLQT